MASVSFPLRMVLFFFFGLVFYSDPYPAIQQNQEGSSHFQILRIDLSFPSLFLIIQLMLQVQIMCVN